MAIQFHSLADIDAEIATLTARLDYLKKCRKFVAKNPPPGDAPLLDHIERLGNEPTETTTEKGE